MDDDQAPICPACGVTMVPAALAAQRDWAGEWVCLECEETGEASVYRDTGPKKRHDDRQQ